MDLKTEMFEIARKAKIASRQISKLTTDEKNKCLLKMADALDSNVHEIIEANRLDVEAAKDAGLSPSLIDRLRLDEKRVSLMSNGIRQVAKLPDPVGRILDERVRPNGLKLRKVSVPIGVICIIYESRPNVTADSAGLCFKSGNVTILRGGKEAIHSNTIIANLLVNAAKLASPQFPDGAIQLIKTPDRNAIKELLSLSQYIDLCIPRGGEGLIRTVAECSRVPVVKHYKGVCHVYLDKSAKFDMSERIVINAKCQRPGVCNAMETLLIHSEIANTLLPILVQRLLEHNVELRLDPRGLKIAEAVASKMNLLHKVKPATEDDWYAEYLDLILAVRIVDNIQEAIDHINQYGSAHSDAIVTEDETTAQKFLNEVDSAAVYWNASTRFTDGGEFGMGAEIGISTDKIGARGPMGLEELTTYKWLGYGNGQIRQ